MGAAKSLLEKAINKKRDRKKAVEISYEEFTDILRGLAPLLAAGGKSGSQMSVGLNSAQSRVLVRFYYKGESYQEYFRVNELDWEYIINETGCPDDLANEVFGLLPKYSASPERETPT